MNRGERMRLPHTRQGQTHKVMVGTVALYITVNVDDNGNPIEVFAKADEGHQADADGLAELSSVLLQYGCPVDVVIKHLRYRKYPPQGTVGQPCSISDAIGRMLEQAEREREGEVLETVEGIA